MKNANLVSGKAGVAGWAAVPKAARPTCAFASLIRVVLGCAALGLLAATTGCDGDRAAGPAPRKTLADRFEIKVGGKTVRVQVAVLEAEMMRGLMERRELAPDEGMLFVYRWPQRLSFWMRNTPLPLDIGFFNRGGVLEEIYALHPYDETSVQSRSTALVLALEMNQGWFHDNGVKPGAAIDLEAVQAALTARGFEARRFALGE